MDEINKITEEQGNEELKEQNNEELEIQETSTHECEDIGEPVSEPVAETPAPKAPIPKLPFIVGGAVAGVVALAVSVALILGGGSHKHSFGEWKSVDEPTCLTAGIEERVCECDERETRPIAALGHTEVVDSAVDPTCTSIGLTEGKHCSTCGTDIVAQTLVDKLSHTYDDSNDIDCNNCGETREVVCMHTETEVIPGMTASCTDTGFTDGEKCKKCGVTLIAQQEIPMIPHTYDDKYDDECNICGHKRDTECAHTEIEVILGKEATCTSAGLTDGEKCKKCGETLVCQSTIPVKAHTEVVDVAVEATCTSKGLTEGKHCSVCSKIIVAQNVINMKPHTEVTDIAVESTCTSTGLTSGKHCGICNKVLVAQTVTDMKPHTEVIDAAVEATCTATGLTEGKHCSVCNKTLVTQQETPKVDHIYDDEYDATCNKCGFVREAECAHKETETIKGYAATCTQTGLTDGAKCKKCGEVLVVQQIIPKLAHTETTIPSAGATCTSTGLTVGTKCSVCGITLVAQQETPKAAHTETTIPAVSATCTSTGLTAGTKCSVCGITLVAQQETPKAIHTYDNKYDESCNKCGFVRDAECAHPTVEIVLGYDSTCTEPGLADGTRCGKCGEILIHQAVIPIKPHTESTDAAVEATCTSTGLTSGKHCGICNKVLVAQTVTNMKPHTEVTDIAVESTCTSTGLTSGKHCGICNKVLVAQTVTDMKPHTEAIDAAVEATCTATGLTEGKHCSVCNKTLVTQQETPKVDHIYDDKYDATCNKCGFVREAECAHKETETIKGYAATCTQTGLTDGAKCKKCGEIIIAQTTITMKPHTEVAYDAVAPTCTSTGLTEGKKCANCGKILIAQEVVPATGHDHEAIVTAPTCIEKGYTTYTCDCGDSYVADEVAAPGHIEGELITSAAPTATTDGFTEYKCSVCGDSYIEAIIPIDFTVTAGNRSKIGYRGVKEENLVIPAVFKDNDEWYRVKKISDAAFYNCSKLKSITIPDSVTYIGRGALRGCSSLTSITIPFVGSRSMATAGYDQVFGYIFGYYAMEDSIINDPDTTLQYWEKFSDGLSSHYRYYCYYIPDSITTVVINGGMVGAHAFYDCDMLTNVSIVNSVTIIDKEAFYNCDALKSVIIGDNVKRINESAFGDCDSITEVVIPSSVISVGKYAFAWCDNLSSATISSGSIGTYAFGWCSLKNVTIGVGVTSIVSSAFTDNISLNQINYTGTVKQWYKISTEVGWNKEFPAKEVICSDGTVALK